MNDINQFVERLHACYSNFLLTTENLTMIVFNQPVDI